MSYPHTVFVIKSMCTNCGECKAWCMAQAIEQKDDCVEIDSEKCIGCDRCIEPCPENAIDILLK